jgi:hypothetical protein
MWRFFIGTDFLEGRMGLEKFKEVRFKPRSLARIELCNTIIDDYLGQGLRLTLRQLYYQLVTRNAITNEEKSYDNLGALVSNARLAGRMDWDAIEDRVRVPRRPLEFRDLNHRIDSALTNYRLPRWDGQKYYVELWVEKDALAGVLAPLAAEYHVTMMVNRGYSSTSALYESAKRFLAACSSGLDDCEDCGGTGLCPDCGGVASDECTTCGGEEECVTCNGSGSNPETFEYERWPVLLYLGDHDPSGEDMVRDVADRLTLFGVRGLQVTKLALTMDQVKKYNPPPNPAKMSDSRAKKYVKKHGKSSWEVDALPPNVLAQLIRDAFRTVLDKKKMKAVVEREELDKKKLLEAVASIRE